MSGLTGLRCRHSDADRHCSPDADFPLAYHDAELSHPAEKLPARYVLETSLGAVGSIGLIHWPHGAYEGVSKRQSMTLERLEPIAWRRLVHGVSSSGRRVHTTLSVPFGPGSAWKDRRD